MVDELYHHVVVSARGGRVNVSNHLAGERYIVLENRQLPYRNVLAVRHEALVLSEPVEPLGSRAIRRLDGPVTVRNRVGRIARVAGARIGRGRGPIQLTAALKIEAGRPGVLRWKMRVVLPGVRAGLKAGRVFEVESRRIAARLVLQVMGKKLCLDLRAELGTGVFTCLLYTSRCV